MSEQTFSKLVKLTVHVRPGVMESLEAAARLTGHSFTDTISRAIEFYSEIIEATKRPPRRLEFLSANGPVVRLLVLPEDDPFAEDDPS